MDYCVKDSTLNPCADTCERERTTSDIVKETKKALSETMAVLNGIRLSLEGTNAPERKTEEPKCFHDDVKAVENLAMDCMALAHIIADRLFGTFH